MAWGRKNIIKTTRLDKKRRKRKKGQEKRKEKWQNGRARTMFHKIMGKNLEKNAGNRGHNVIFFPYYFNPALKRAQKSIWGIRGKVLRDGWLSRRDGWLSRYRASLLRQYSGFESRHPSKIVNGRHKRRSGQHTLARQKNIQKIYIYIYIWYFFPLCLYFFPLRPCNNCSTFTDGVLGGKIWQEGN